VISSFHHEVDENCTLPGYYTARSGNSLLTFQGKPIGHIFAGQESDT